MTTAAAESTALVQARAGGLAALTAVNNPFAQAARNEGVTDGFWLRMNGKSGVWITNLPGTTELAEGTELVFNLWNAELLWQGFDKENRLHNGPKVTILSGQPLPDHAGTPGVKWGKNIRVMVSTTDGGQKMALTCKANNQYREIWKLVKRYGELFTRFPDPTGKPVPPFPTAYKMPIVKLGARGYDMTVKEEKVVTDPNTGAKSIVMDETKIHNFSEVLTISDNEADWISHAEMLQILEDAGVDAGADAAPAQAIAAPTAAATAVAPQAAAAAPAPQVQAAAATAAAPGQPLTGEIISPPAAAPAASGFRRGRIGQRT